MNGEDFIKRVVTEYAKKDQLKPYKNKYVFSQEFEEKMEEILQKPKKKESDTPEEKLVLDLKTSGRLSITVMFMILFLIISSIGAQADKNVTATFGRENTRFGTLVYNEPIDATLHKNEEENIIKTFYIPTPPKGYKICDTYKEIFLFNVAWEDESGAILNYNQRMLSMKDYINPDENGFYEFEEEQTNYIFYKKDGTNNLLWSDIGYAYALSSKELDMEALTEISKTLDLYEGS